MIDRQPGAPGQYKAILTAAEFQKMQAGQKFTITLTRDDQPIVEGTPYSKAAVLPDDLAKIICPDVQNPTPADAFRALLPRNGKAAMTADLPMGGYKVTGLGKPAADGDAVSLGFANQQFAPGGFGLGKKGRGTESIECTSDEELKMKTANTFWVHRNDTIPLIPGYSGTRFVKGLALSYNDYCATHIGTCNESGTIILREMYGTTPGNWGNWFMLNPQMAVGVEYPTMFRLEGKVVYTKLLNFGKMPAENAGGITHDSSVKQIVRCEGMNTTLGSSLGYHETRPIPAAICYATKTQVWVEVTSDCSAYDAMVQIWYTKE